MISLNALELDRNIENIVSGSELHCSHLTYIWDMSSKFPINKICSVITNADFIASICLYDSSKYIW